MSTRQEDARLLAASHREICPRGRCINECPEASPLYWMKALQAQTMPSEASHDVIRKRTGSADVAQELRESGSVVERAEALIKAQSAVIDDMHRLMHEFETDKLTPEALAIRMRLVLGSKKE